jgi:signal transduction histidine kinase
MTDRIDVDEADLGEGTVVLAPDASILGAIGRGHTLASALADLIDNSIDAGATRVSIRFVTHNAVVRSIRIRDDGCGMTVAQLERAMTLGGGGEHSGSDQGLPCRTEGSVAQSGPHPDRLLNHGVLTCCGNAA